MGFGPLGLTVRSGFKTSVKRIPEYDLENEGWVQLQRCAMPLLCEMVQRDVLHRYDLSVWCAIAGQVTVKSGTAGVGCMSLARTLRCSHEVVARSLKKLEAAGVLLRVRPGEYQPSPWLIRSGGPGRHAQLFKWFHERWVKRHGCPPPDLFAST